MRLRTNAKTNLLLRVLGRRPDGYHEIETIFHTLSLADTVSLATTTGDAVDIDMHAEGATGAELPPAADNLVSTAARKLIEAGGRTHGVRIDIVKRIPIGAGLGGGSGNAAGVLEALNEMWGLGLDSGALAELALDIGADVPYCLTGGTALATGRGEKTSALPAPATLWFALGLSDEPLLTRDVYDDFETHSDPADVRSAPMSLALGMGDVTAIAALMHNDLEPPAFRLRPELAELKSKMLDAGALGTVMSGSGPTMVGLARDQQHAISIAVAAERSFDRVVVSSSRPTCIERLDEAIRHRK
jgi:4-diphosphocytidyl-2-C-methyl-D-erythritol kinase